MRKIIVLGAALSAVLATPAFAQSFVGQWTATAKSPQGDSSETLTVAKTAGGYSITGKPATPPPEGVTVTNGEEIVLDGNNFAYSRTINAGQTAIKITYKGAVSGDTFTGTASLGGTELPYTGVRVAAGK